MGSTEHEGFTDGDLQELQKTFSLFDKNQDGSITTQEMKTVLKALGHDVTTETVNALISKIDDNQNGTVEFKEFLKMMTHMQEESKSQEEDLRDVFETIDVDGNGLITLTDLRLVASHVGIHLEEEELEEMIQEADTNGTGQVEYDELVQVITGL